MFRKDFSGGIQTLLSNKDRKRLREHALRVFPLLKESDFDTLFPSKAEISVSKWNLPQATTPAGGGAQQPSSVPPLLSATSVNKCLLYFVGDPPIPVFGEINGTLFPTVYGLWRVPTMVPSFLVFEPVSSFVLKGADVMLPGVSVQLTAAAAERDGVSQISPGDFWSVRVAGNQMPFAVGRAVPFANPVSALASKGKALSLVHHFGDAIWKMGDRSAPSALFTRSLIKSGSDDCDLLRACGILDASTLRGVASAEASENNNPTEEAAGEARTEQVSEEGPFADKEASPVAKDDSSAPAPVAEAECKGDSDSKVETNVEQEVSAEGSSVSLEIPVETMDRYLELCLLEVLHALSDDQLPLDVSALYSKITTDAPAVYFAKVASSNSAPFVAPDLKKSSFKKLAKFIQHATKRKWLHTKEQRKVVSVVDVNRSHPDYKSYCPVPEAQKAARLEKAKTDAAAASGGQTASEKNASSATECAEEEAPAASPKQTKNAAGPLVLEFWMPPSKCSKIFSLAGARTGKEAFFTAQEYREVLAKYLALQAEAGEAPADASCVALDQFLMEALLTKEERLSAKKSADSFSLTKEDAFVRWEGTRVACHAVLSDASEQSRLAEKLVITRKDEAAAAALRRKGPCNPILVSVTDRMGGRKHSTNVLNVTNFHLDPKHVAEVLQKKLAASAALFAPPGSKLTTAISVQGNVASAVAELLISHFNIPRKYVEVEGKKGSAGKR